MPLREVAASAALDAVARQALVTLTNGVAHRFEREYETQLVIGELTSTCRAAHRYTSVVCT